MNFLKTNNLPHRFVSTLFGRYFWGLLLIVGLWGATGETVRASHLVGADLTYTCLGNGQYEISLTLYRDCGGISMGTSQTVSFNSASGCGASFTSVLAMDVANSGVEVSQLCPSALPQSECNGPGLYPGIEVYVYTGIITLPAECDDWIVSFTQCCRNPDATNLVDPDFEDLYVQANINNANGLCNNSPSFTTRPIPYICAGQPFTFNHGVVEPDGDSLVYTLADPMTFGGVAIAHTPGFTANYPLATAPANTFNFNTSTGQMSFTPQGGTAQTAVIAVIVYEIRNGDTISSIMRDMQVVVLTNCTNQAINANTAPLVNVGGSYDSLSRSFIVCAGDTLIFSLTITDPNPTDTVELDLVNTNLAQVFGVGNYAILPIQGATPNVLDVYVVVYSVTANLGVNSFALGFTDNACPVPSTPVLGFNVIIPGVEVVAADTSICAGIAQNIPLTAESFSSIGGASSGSYQWTQVSGPPAPLTANNIYNPIAQIPANTTAGDSIVYQVDFVTAPDPVTGTQCFTSDRITIYLVNLPLTLLMQASDYSLCPNNLNETISLSTAVSGPGVNLTNGTYQWTSTPASYQSGFTSTSINNPDITVSGGPGDQFNLTVSYTYGVCTGSTTQTFQFNQAQISMPNDTSICAGTAAALNTNFTSLLAATSGQCGPSTAACNGASTQVLSGTANATSVFPFRGFWEDGRCQFIYRASELQAMGVTPGLITQLAWNIVFKYSNQPFQGFTIRMGCTSLNEFVGGFPPQAYVAGLTQVYTNAGVSTTAGWNNYVLQTPYEWDGFSNIIVEVCFNNSSWFDDDEVQAETTTYTSGLLFEADGVVGCVAASEYSGTARPIIRFTSCPLAPPYTFQWSPSIGFGAPGADTLAPTTVSPPQTTTYTVAASDGECVLTASMTVTVLSNLPAPTISCVPSSNPATEIIFAWGNVPGATGWEYSVDSGATWTTVPLSMDTLVLPNLLNGTCITVFVRAVGGSGPCVNNASASLTCCTSPCSSGSTTIGFTDVSCFGDTDGTIAFQGVGGTLGAPYSFVLFDAATGVAIDTTVQTLPNGTGLHTGLAPGTYYGYVIDDFGCLGFTDTITIGEPALLVASLDNVTQTLCYNTEDGTGLVSAVGGITPYTYLWDANANNQTTALATGLGIGFYQATITDANGCQQVVSNIPITSPFAQAPVIQISTTNSTACPGNGTATVTGVQNMTGNPNPGQPNSISYAWQNGQTNTLTAINLGVGEHTITVTDINGCSTVDTFEIDGVTVFINGSTTQDPDCGQSNGFITPSVGGGTAPYSFAWSMGQTGASATGLSGGSYGVTVTDANGCSTTGTFVLMGGSVSITVVDQNEILTCFGDADGSVDIEVTSVGLGSVSYLWSNGATTQDLTGLTAGVYTVTVTQQFGANPPCVSTQTITIQQPAEALTVGINVSQLPNCDNVNGGQLGVAVNGGWGGYSLLWSTGATTTDLGNLPGGVYGVTLTDAQGCQATASVNIPAVEVPVVNPWIGTFPSTSVSVSEGTAGIVLDAGINPSQASISIFNWSPGTNVANPTAASTTVDAPDEGTYVYTVEARIGSCSDTGSVTLIVLPTALRGMPDAFTPNGDDLNDTFKPAGAENVTYHVFHVYNRFGQKVYDGASNEYEGWDGEFSKQPQPRDAYTYVIEYQLFNSTERVTLRGEVMLIR